MKSKIVGISIVPIAIALVVTAAGFAGAQRPAGAATTAERQQAQLEIARSRVTSRLEAALGDDFGGIWLDPSTAQLHVGVPSAESRHSAEAAASDAGVAGIVTETPVRSTWTELKAAQHRWAERMADLFDRAEVVTSLRAQYNALEVELGSAVPDSRRVALERAAALDDANVLVRTGQSKHFRVEDQKRCATFVSGSAKCDPTIVAGVSLVHDKEAKAACTAGPTIIPKDASSAALATDRRILTAGHCIAAGMNSWYAYYRKIEPEKQLIGLASFYLSGHIADIGIISMDPMSKWRQAGFTPVNPAIAQWNNKAETDPIPVIGEREPFENAETCISGQISGKLCGKVVAVGKTFKDKSNMAEVNVNTQPGDSGAPWYAKEYAEAGGGLVEGVHTGVNESNNTAVFQPLKIGLEKLKEQTGADYELLTTTNEERRHPVATAPKYPTTASAKGASEDLFTAFGSTIKCTESEYDGELSKASASIEVTPTYKSCTGPAGLPVLATANGCKYKFNLKEEVAEGQFSSEVDLVCPVGEPGLQFHMYTSHTNLTSNISMCTVTIPPQTGLKSVTLKNSGNNVVIEKATIESIKVKMHRNSILCSAGPGTEVETSSGVYDLNKAATLAGTSGGESVKIDIGGA